MTKTTDDFSRQQAKSNILSRKIKDFNDLIDFHCDGSGNFKLTEELKEDIEEYQREFEVFFKMLQEESDDQNNG